MKLDCSKDALKNAVGLAERMVGKNLSLPVLGGILFSAQNNKLLLPVNLLVLRLRPKQEMQEQEQSVLLLQPVQVQILQA